MGMPSLWNNVAVAFPRDKAAECALLKNMLEAFLLRSGDSLISLKIVAEDLVDCDSFIQSIIDLILPYIGQLRHLSLNPSDPFHLLLEGNVHALESADLEFSEKFDADPNVSSMMLLDKTCNLRRVTISSDFVDLDLTIFHFSWTHLTQLSFRNTYLTFAQGHAMLRHCINLVSLTFGIIPDIECHAMACNTILPVLESLTIMILTSEECGQFLRPFILPSLKRLEVDATGTHFQWSEVVLPQLVRRSSCHLKRFEVSAFAPSAVIALLTVAPSITRLSLQHLNVGRCREPSYNTNLLGAIARGDLVPNLQIIECNLYDLEYIIDVVEMRSKTAAFHIPPSTPIRSMVVHGYPGMKWQGVQESLSRLRTQGTNITFRDTSIKIAKRSGRRIRISH
jgi:hypothetical protein